MSIGSPASIDYGQYPQELRDAPAEASRACRVCGQRRGSRDADADWVEDGPWSPAGPRRTVRDDDGRLVDVLKDQPWRWRHTRCVPSATSIVAALTGVEVEEAVAHAALDAAELGIARHANMTARRPWAFVTGEQRDRLRSEVGRAIAATRPRRHVTGRCTWCGRSRSLVWWKSAQLWADGSGVACDTCHEAEVPLQSWDEVARRRAGVRLFAGLVDAVGHAAVNWGFKFASEVVPGDERHADDCDAWTYSPALAEVKQRAYRGESGSIADPVIGEMWRRIAAGRRAQARRDREADAETAEPPIAW